MDLEKIELAAETIRNARYAVAFTGAGISVESGIPSFRGEDGLWQTHDPIFVEIEYFQKKPLASWSKIKEVFYDMLNDVEPNIAHINLAKMEKRSFVESVITQNIDSLHQKARRPLKTNLNLTKAKQEFNYQPKSFREGLTLLDEQIKKIKLKE